MSRDLSLKTIRIHGKRVKCRICKEHDAVARFYDVLVCRKCLKPLTIGFLTGQNFSSIENELEGEEE